MEFVILGPFEVLERGQQLAVGGAGQQALLAVLLLHRDRAVASDRLIDLLWGEDPPRTAAKTVQVYVSRLRKVLGGQLLLTEGRGYRLAVAADQVDAERFERLSREGRAELDAGDAKRAVALFGDALALWRGAPLADFAYERFAQAEIERLAELKLGVIEDRLDAELALGGDGRLVPELEVLVAENRLRERLRGQLMLALYRAGRHSDALAVYRQASTTLRDELGLDPSPALRELERRILDHDPSLTGASDRAAVNGGATRPVLCPFKGIAPFDRADANLFFGRERIVGDLVARVAEGDLAGIIGPSGTGKSSLLRAGLLAALNGGALPGSGRWRHVLLRPGEHPAGALLSALDGVGLDEVLDSLGPGERLVIAVDQFEELFTQCDSEPERRRLIAALATAARDTARRAVVIVALRSDFYGRFASYRGFSQLLTRSHVLVGPMDRAELASAIEKPAALAGLDVDERLVDELVSDVAGELGGLPLLSTTLLELWRAGEGRALRLETYRASGGIHAAVARLAEDAYGQLDDSARQIARTVMLRLAAEQDGTPTRRRAPVAELEAIQGAAPVLAALIDARLLTLAGGAVELTHEALLREWPRYAAWREEDRAGNQLRAHLATAAQEWETHGRDPGDLYRGARLAGVLDWAAEHSDQLNSLEHKFIDASRDEANREQRRQRIENRRLRSMLVLATVLLIVAVAAAVVAREERQTARDDARVALGRQLGAEAVNEPRIELAMLMAREAVRLDRSPQTESELLTTLLRDPLIIGTLAPGGSSPVATFSPDGRTLAVGNGTGQLHFYATTARAQTKPPLEGFLGPQPPVYSADGSLLAYVTRSGPAIKVLNARTRAPIATLPLDRSVLPPTLDNVPGNAIAISPDDRTLYYTSWIEPNAYVQRWALPSGRRLPMANGVYYVPVLTTGLADHGSRLLVVSAVGSIAVLDAHSLRLLDQVWLDPQLPFETPVEPDPATTALSPNGRQLLIGSPTGAIFFVDTATGRVRQGPVGLGAGLVGAGYADGGRTAVTVGVNDRVIIWDARHARPERSLIGPAVEANGAAISTSGASLYTATRDGVLLDWDLTGRDGFGRRSTLGANIACCQPLSPLSPPFAVSPDGSTIAVRLGPSTAGVFSARSLNRRGAVTIGHADGPITALALSPNGRQLAVGAHSGLVQVWSAGRAPRRVRAFSGLAPTYNLPEAVQALAFSPNGRLLAASDASLTGGYGGGTVGKIGALATWVVRSGARRALIQLNNLPAAGAPQLTLEPGNTVGEDALAFSPDDRRIALGTYDGHVAILDTTGRVRRELTTGVNSTALAFGLGGTLAVGTAIGTVELWNPTTGKELAAPAVAASGPVTSIAFDPSGNRFATAGAPYSAVTLWFTKTLQQDGTQLPMNARSAASISFDPRSGQLIAVDDHGRLFQWPTGLPALEARACAIAGGIAREATALISDLPPGPVCP